MRTPMGMTVFAALVAVPYIALAADADLRTAIQEMTGGTSREWVKTIVQTVMGDGNRCTAGETYTFSKDGKATILNCGSQGILTKREVSWSLGEDGIDKVLTLDGQKYLVAFRKAGGVHEMRLRQRSGSKTEATTDTVFRYEAE